MEGQTHNRPRETPIPGSDGSGSGTSPDPVEPVGVALGEPAPVGPVVAAVVPLVRGVGLESRLGRGLRSGLAFRLGRAERSGLGLGLGPGVRSP